MGTGYVRQSLAEIQNGVEIEAGPLNDEFDALEATMDAIVGHSHDGTTGNAPPIDLTTSVDGILPVGNLPIGTSGNTVPVLNGNNNWSGTNTFTAGVTFAGNDLINVTGADPKVRFTDTDTGANSVLNYNTGHGGAIFAFDQNSEAANTTLEINIDGAARATFSETVLTMGTNVAIAWAGTGAATTRTNLGVDTAANTVTNTGGASAWRVAIGLDTAADVVSNTGGAVSWRSALGLGTAAVENTGTSGHTIPFLDGTNSWTNTQTITAGGITMSGSATVGANVILTGGDYMIRTNTTSESLILRGGNTNGINVGAYINLFGSTHATNPGVGIISSQGTGSLFLRFANGNRLAMNSADVECFTGMTFSGTNRTITASTDVQSVFFSGGSTVNVVNGATINLYGAGHATNAGMVLISTDSNGLPTSEIRLRYGATNKFVISGTANSSTQGLNFGSATVGTDVDLSRHIALYGTTYGFSVTSGALNIVTGGNNMNFYRSADAVSFVNFDFGSDLITMRGDLYLEGTGLTVDGNSQVGNLNIFTFSATGASNGKSMTSTAFELSRSVTTNQRQIGFYNPNGLVGGIRTNGTATIYDVASDERLKEDFQEINPALVDAINVYDFSWKADGVRAHGVKAQELEAAGVCPIAVGAPDAEIGQEFYSVDYSKLIPLMIASIKELRARVAELEG